MKRWNELMKHVDSLVLRAYRNNKTASEVVSMVTQEDRILLRQMISESNVSDIMTYLVINEMNHTDQMGDAMDEANGKAMIELKVWLTKAAVIAVIVGLMFASIAVVVYDYSLPSKFIEYITVLLT